MTELPIAQVVKGSFTAQIRVDQALKRVRERHCDVAL